MGKQRLQRGGVFLVVAIVNGGVDRVFVVIADDFVIVELHRGDLLGIRYGVVLLDLIQKIESSRMMATRPMSI